MFPLLSLTKVGYFLDSSRSRTASEHAEVTNDLVRIGILKSAAFRCRLPSAVCHVRSFSADHQTGFPESAEFINKTIVDETEQANGSTCSRTSDTTPKRVYCSLRGKIHAALFSTNLFCLNFFQGTRWMTSTCLRDGVETERVTAEFRPPPPSPRAQLSAASGRPKDGEKTFGPPGRPKRPKERVRQNGALLGNSKPK